MDDEIAKIGIKAYSLKLLKEKGLFTENLLISSKLYVRSKFIELLKKEGFREGDEFMCRFSHPSKAVHLARAICNSFDETYNFFKENYKKGLTVIVQKLMHAKYEGTISNIKGELVLEFIEGDWSGDYSLNVDTIIFRESDAVMYLYKGKRKVPYVEGRQIQYKEIDPISDETAKKILEGLGPKIKLLRELLSDQFNSLELLIDDDGRIQPLKLLNITSNSIKELPLVDGQVFELKTPHDLKHWDKKTKLLISIPANIDRADALMSVIHEIKKSTDNVFIGYGELSHPAILMREAGLKVERRISNYKILKFNY